MKKILNNLQIFKMRIDKIINKLNKLSGIRNILINESNGKTYATKFHFHGKLLDILDLVYNKWIIYHHS